LGFWPCRARPTIASADDVRDYKPVRI
jgi:hypothetical protein